MKKTNPKIMDIAVELARKKFKSEAFSFYQLADLVAEKKYEFDTADLYISMIEDVRFLSIGKQKWKLSETFKFEEAEKIKMSMFGDKNSFAEEDINFDESMTDEERELAFMEDVETEPFEPEEESQSEEDELENAGIEIIDEESNPENIEEIEEYDEEEKEKSDE